MEEGAYEVKVNEEITYDILCTPIKKEIPEEQLDLHMMVEETADIIKIMPIREIKDKTKKVSEKGLLDSLSSQLKRRKFDHAKNISMKLASIYNETEPPAAKDEQALLEVKNQKDVYFIQLISIAQVGLEGKIDYESKRKKKPKYAHTKLALKAIDQLRAEILITEGVRIKNRHVSLMGLFAFLLGAAAVGLGLLLREISLGNTNFFRFLVYNNIYPYFFVFAGSMIGAWIACIVRKEQLVFRDLAIMEGDMLKTIPRLFFVGVTSVVFLLFLKALAIELSVGTITITDIMGDIENQFFVGAIAGLLGNSLAKSLTNKASSIVGTNGTNTAG